MTGGSGNTTITFNGNVSGVDGVVATSSSTGSMSVSGTGNAHGLSAIKLQNTATATSGDLTVNMSGNITGNGGVGIAAQIANAANNANISVTDTGTISGSGFGISAVTAGGGNVLVNMSNSISSSGGLGIAAEIATGGITITSGLISSQLQGIDARITGGSSGGITITANGAITSSTDNGINTVVTGSGNTAITLNGNVSGVDGVAATAGSGNITVTNAATVTVAGSSIGVQLIGGTIKTLNNFGTITGATGTSMTTGSSNVFNVGTITGTGGTAIQFAGNGNTLTLAPTSVINGNLLGAGADTFQLGGSGTGSFDASLIGPAAQYRGFSSFNKVSDSIWTLTGTSALVLPWTVQQGTLSVTGTLSNSPFTVNNGGTLAGTGTVGDVTVASGGKFAPGPLGTPGAITVAGNLAFQSGGIYLVNLTPATASIANVSGSATLTGGSVQALMATGNYIAMSYDILHATGGLGGTTFSSVSVSRPNFSANLSYTSTDVFLNLTAALGAGGSLNGNQQNVANAINGFFNGGGTLPPGFNTLFALTGNNLSSALSQVSGEVGTGSQQTTFNAMGLFMGLLTDPFVAGRGDPIGGGGSPNAYADETMAYAANGKSRSKSERDAYAAVYTKAPPLQPSFEQRWSVWAAGFGGSQTTDGNAALGSNNTTSRIAGGVVGADYRFSPFTLAGFALAGGGTNFSVANGLGSGRSDLFQAGAFVRHNAGPAYLTGALAYGWQDITTDRTVTIAGVDQLRARFNANAFSGRVEGGYRFLTPWTGVTPYAAGQFTTFDLPAYAEQAVVGSNTFALAYGSKSVTASRSELGLRTDNSWAMQDGIFTLRGRAAWAHDFNSDRVIGATFQTLPGASFVVNGAAQAHDAALVTASAEKKWLNGWSAAATFEGEFSNVTRSYAGKGVVRYTW